MERLHITDVRHSPETCVVWVTLDHAPTDAWIGRLDRALDDGVRRVRPAVVDGDRVYLRVDGVDECDAFAILADYVDAANRATAAVSHSPRQGAIRPPTDR